MNSVKCDHCSDALSLKDWGVCRDQFRMERCANSAFTGLRNEYTNIEEGRGASSVLHCEIAVP